MNRFLKATAAIAMAVLLVACGGDDDSSGGDPAAADLIDAMMSEGASEDEAKCFIDELGLDDAERIYGADESDLSEDDMASALDAFQTCSSDGITPDEPEEESAPEESESEDGEQAALSSAEATAGDLADVRACLQDGGLSVGDSSAPEELNESLGILDSVTVVSEQGGAGVVTLYENSDLATEAREYQSSTEGDIDGVTIGQVVDLVYSYSGDREGRSALEECVF